MTQSRPSKLGKMGHKGHYSKKEEKKDAQRQLLQARGEGKGRGIDACHDFTKLSFFRRSLPLQWLLQKYFHSAHSIPHVPTYIHSVSSPFISPDFDTNFESLEVESFLFYQIT